jgi:hypothetical protein
MARIHYVILAHEEPINLLGLLGSLWNSNDAFSIWLDGKSSLQFQEFARSISALAGNVHVYVGNVMSWGGFSIVETTLKAYTQLCCNTDDFSHAILCSGTHIPLLHPDKIFPLIKDFPGWMDFTRVPNAGRDLRQYDQLASGWLRDVVIRFRYRYAELEGIGMIAGEDRSAWIGSDLIKGSQWHVLRRDVVEFIVYHQSRLRNEFNSVFVADEHAFQSILSESPWSDGFIRGDHLSMQWVGASPKRISFDEAKSIAKAQRFLFARKAQSNSTAEQWISWSRLSLENEIGTSWLETAFRRLQPLIKTSSQALPVPETTRSCLEMIKPLLAELLEVLKRELPVTKDARDRYVIPTHRYHPEGGHVFLLCFTEARTGLSVVPALRRAELTASHSMSRKLAIPTFGKYISLPLLGQPVWRIGTLGSTGDWNTLAQALLSFQTRNPMHQDS